MRLIYTSTNPREGRMLSTLLTKKGIENFAEVKVITDWGNDRYGDPITQIWVVDEDKFEEGLKLVDAFYANPKAPEFAQQEEPQPLRVIQPDSSPKILRAQERRPSRPKSLTLFLLIFCTLLYLYIETSTPHLTAIPTYLPAMPLVSSPLIKDGLYDYPKTYVLTDRLVALYGLEQLETPDDLPAAGKTLLQTTLQTPYWHGFYQVALNHFRHAATPPVPLFEKIREGEIWRVLSPCFLHAEILHLLFNMLWLAVLGRQIEERTGKFRYAILIILAGIFSNTCQYLMGGPDFIGFSGVVCALLTFIWSRQKKAPWEGYPLERSTFVFLITFIVVIGLTQALSFASEVLYQTPFSPGIANTAHLSGAAIGLVLGRIPFFAWRGP